MDIKKIVLVLTLTLCPWTKSSTYTEKAVTYETTNGRFGDNLLSYMHGKWVAYKYNLPLLYRPFIYSDDLIMHEKELHFTNKTTQSLPCLVPLGRGRSVLPGDTSVLYHVPYFPESRWELDNCPGYSGGPWDYLEVDWNDHTFIETLRQMIKPRKPLAQLTLPADRITVALHMRRGGNYDPHQTVVACPLKFLPDSFFIEHVEILYHLLDEQPLYVHIFTDDHCPNTIREMFQNHFKNHDIQFECREQGNSENNNVLEDFFALLEFDCLIHSESNYSLTASKLGNYMVSIYPDSFCKEDNRVAYDHVNTTINHSHPKMKLRQP